jgi:hypothetical protein
MKNIYTLVEDIYDLVETKQVPEGVDIEKCIEAFGEGVKRLMRHEFTQKRDDSRKLRMSNIGRRKSVKLTVLVALWTAKLTALSLMLKACPLLGLENSKTEVSLLMTRLATFLKLRDMQEQKAKLSTDG